MTNNIIKLLTHYDLPSLSLQVHPFQQSSTLMVAAPVARFSGNEAIAASTSEHPNLVFMIRAQQAQALAQAALSVQNPGHTPVLRRSGIAALGITSARLMEGDGRCC